MTDKELNTGEPVAYVNLERWKVCDNPEHCFSKSREDGDTAVYSQDYVNQLLGEIESLKEKMCQAIYEEAAYCYDNGDYMLDYSDCQSIIRGTWKRPAYNGESNVS